MNSVNGSFVNALFADSRGVGGSRYAAEDVQKILAIALNSDADTVSAAQLQEMADELSIEPSVLASSVKTWQRQKAESQAKRDRRKAFYRQQLLPFLTLNTFLILLDISLAGTITWAIYPLLGTGIGLFFKPCRKSVSPNNSSCFRPEP